MGYSLGTIGGTACTALVVAYLLRRIFLSSRKRVNNAQFYSEKRIIITGASMGVGEGLALSLATFHTKLTLAARSKEALEDVAKRCLDRGAASVKVIVCDVAKEEDCRRLIQESVAEFGGIDVLILNAGVSMSCPFDQVSDLSIFRRLMDVNYLGCVYITHAALPHIVQSKGTIGVVSSGTGRLGLPFRTGYCASKHALHGFFDALRLEQDGKSSGIHISLMCLGFVATNIREHHMKAGESQPEIHYHEGKMMSVEKCVHRMLGDMANHVQEDHFGFSVTLALLLRLFAPRLVDAEIRRKVFSLLK